MKMEQEQERHKFEQIEKVYCESCDRWVDKKEAVELDVKNSNEWICNSCHEELLLDCDVTDKNEIDEGV